MIEWTIQPHAVLFRVADDLGYWRPDGSKPWDVFLWGIRGNPRRVDHYDDLIGATAWVDGRWQTWVFQGTVDPGLPYMVDPMNPAGTARIKPDQYRGMWELGSRRNGDAAFMQVGPVTVQRDRDGNGSYNEDAPSMSGLFAILLHAPFRDGAEKVGRSSAGCVVPKTLQGFQQLHRVGKRQVSAGLGDRFTWTLFDLQDCPELAFMWNLEAKGHARRRVHVP